MTTNALSVVRGIVEKTIATSQVSGIAVATARGKLAPTSVLAGTDAAGLPLSDDTLYPVASLTKLAVALAILRLVDRGRVRLDHALARYLPDARAKQPEVTLRSLLTHTSGLPATLADEADLYVRGARWPAIAAACLRTPLATAPRQRVHYSGVGYSLLALVVERVVGQAFPEALTTLVLEPLGIEGYLGVEPPRPPARIELGDSPFTGTALEFYNSPHFRSLGEPAAGLLTTAEGALRLLRAFHGVPTDFLQPATVAVATRDQTGGVGGGIAGSVTHARCPWGLGPALYGSHPGLIPGAASARSFGHQGASGCMVWCDPEADVVWAILGTRIADNGWDTSWFRQVGGALLTH